MADKVLIYSRFPKTMMARFAERFELLDTGGKPARDVFPVNAATNEEGRNRLPNSAPRLMQFPNLSRGKP